MNLNDIQREEKKEIVTTIRTTKTKHEWMIKHNISPTKLFDKALDELIASQQSIYTLDISHNEDTTEEKK